MKKRLLSLALCLALCLGLFPFGVLAEESDEASVAKVGNTQYTTLAAAIEAAQEGDTITLLRDISENITIESGDVVIDLNDKTWNGEKQPPLTINGGNVTVKNGTIAATGQTWNPCQGIVAKSGTLTIEENMTLTGWGGYVALWWNGGTINPIPVGTVLNSGISVRATDENNEKYPISALLPADAAFAVDGNIINGYTDTYGDTLTDCSDNLTVVAHDSHTYTDGVCECGYRCTHPGGFASGACETCHLSAAAQVGNAYYSTVQEALDKADKTGGTVTLRRDIGEEPYARSETMVTLDLNGHAMEYLVVGNVEHVGYKDVVVGIGKLTVADSTGGGSIKNTLLYGSEQYNSVLNVERGTIANFMLYGGTLNLNGGQIGLEEPGEIPYYNGINAGYGDATINISGGTVIGLDAALDEESPVTVNVTGGTGHADRWAGSENTQFTISGGSFGDVLFAGAADADVRISGGTFSKISAIQTRDWGKENIPLYRLLADGYAFYNQDGNTFASSNATELENVTVGSHTHNMAKGTDGNWVCKDCGFTCDHAKIDAETGVCPTCGEEFAVKVTVDGAAASYYADPYDAVPNAPDDATLTLLQNISNSSLVLTNATAGASKSLTLDMNGKNIADDCQVWVGESGGSSYSLTVIGTGNIGAKISVAKACTLDMSQWQGTLYGISMSADSKVTLPNGCELSELTAFDLGTGGSGTDRNSWHFLPEGYALQYTDTQRFVPYHIDADNAITLKNVKIVPCTNHNIGTDGKCIYCNATGFVATVTKNGVTSAYTTLEAALEAASGGTVKLLADASTIEISSPLTLDLNGKDVTKLTAVTTAKVKDSGETKGIIGSLTVTGGKLADLLEDGYAFADSTNEIQNGYTTSTLNNVTIVPHTHAWTKNETQSSCICGLTCTHKNVDDNGKCTICGYQYAFKLYNPETGKTSFYDVLSGSGDAALYDLPSSGGTITLLRDAESRIAYSSKSKNFTLNLQNFRLSILDETTVSNLTVTLCGGENSRLDGKALRIPNLVLSGDFKGSIKEIDKLSYPLTVDAGCTGTVENLTIYRFSALNEYVSLSGGSFKKITIFFTAGSYDPTLGDLLAEGYRFESTDASDGRDLYYNYQLKETANTIGNLKVVPCEEHTYENGYCKYCNTACTHQWKDGKCTVCGSVCPHDAGATESNGVYTCDTCRQTVTAKVVAPDGTTTYYADTYTSNFKSGLFFAFKAAQSGSTLTMLGGEY